MHFFLSILLLLVPATFDLPPEAPIDSPAIAQLPAERLDPPAAPPEVTTTDEQVSAPAFLSPCDEMDWYRAEVGLPARFDQIGWRESNCRQETGVRTSCCVGWWQLNIGLHLRDHRLVDRYHACGIYSYRDADGPSPVEKLNQACAAKALFDVVGYSAWSL